MAFKPSMMLRQVERRIMRTNPWGFSGHKTQVLQQKWVDVLSGVTEWRDIPIEEESTEENTSCS